MPQFRPRDDDGLGQAPSCGTEQIDTLLRPRHGEGVMTQTETIQKKRKSRREQNENQDE